MYMFSIFYGEGCEWVEVFFISTNLLNFCEKSLKINNEDGLHDAIISLRETLSGM